MKKNKGVFDTPLDLIHVCGFHHSVILIVRDYLHVLILYVFTITSPLFPSHDRGVALMGAEFVRSIDPGQCGKLYGSC